MLPIVHNSIATKFLYAFFVPHFLQNPHQPKDYSMTLIYALFFYYYSLYNVSPIHSSCFILIPQNLAHKWTHKFIYINNLYLSYHFSPQPTVQKIPTFTLLTKIGPKWFPNLR